MKQRDLRAAIRAMPDGPEKDSANAKLEALTEAGKALGRLRRQIAESDDANS